MKKMGFSIIGYRFPRMYSHVARKSKANGWESLLVQRKSLILRQSILKLEGTSWPGTVRESAAVVRRVANGRRPGRVVCWRGNNPQVSDHRAHQKEERVGKTVYNAPGMATCMYVHHNGIPRPNN